jgi:hypothetical protein
VAAERGVAADTDSTITAAVMRRGGGAPARLFDQTIGFGGGCYRMPILPASSFELMTGIADLFSHPLLSLKLPRCMNGTPPARMTRPPGVPRNRLKPRAARDVDRQRPIGPRF